MFVVCKASGRITVAKVVLDMLPPELAAIVEPEERATEYVAYHALFRVWEVLDRVVDCQSLEVQTMSRDTTLAWLKDYRVCPRLYRNVFWMANDAFIWIRLLQTRRMI
jgi:hypothetical protein